jgi:hypothetical protein
MDMPLIAKRSPQIRFEFVPVKKQSILGVQPAIEARDQRFGLWQKIRGCRGLNRAFAARTVTAPN